MSLRQRINGWWVAGGLGGLLLLAGVTASLVFSPADEAGGSEDAVPTQGPTPSPSASPDDPEEHHDHIVLPEDYQVCTDVLDEAEYALLVDRLFAVIDTSINLGRTTTPEDFIPYVTNYYLQLNSDAPPVLRGAEGIVKTLDQEATRVTVNCEINAKGIITTRVTPVITTSRIPEPFTIELRMTEWVRFDGQWYANREF